jgi:hypothetical protein
MEYWRTWCAFLSQLSTELEHIAESESDTLLTEAQKAAQQTHHDIHLHQLVLECSQPQLIAIAIGAATRLGISPPSRNDKRKKARMVAWFASHWVEIEQIIPFIEWPTSNTPISRRTDERPTFDI